jgi:hypothetical protein
MSHIGKKNMKNMREICHKGTKGYSMGKGQQETGWEYVIDRENVTNQVKEAGHDVISDNTFTLTQGGR